MVAEANNMFRPLSNAVHCCAVLLTLKDFSRPHLENINGKKVKMLYYCVHTIYFYKLNPVIKV